MYWRTDAYWRHSCNHDDRRPFLVQFAEQVHHFLSVFTVQVTGRFVGEDQLRVGHYGAGNGDTLLLAAGQLLREMLFAVHDRHPFHCFLYLFLSLGSRYTHVEQRKFYILVYIQLVDQIETLEDEPDNPFAQFRPLGFRFLLHRREVREM